jgi:hypothetical protein
MYYYITTHKSRFFLARAVAIRTKLSSRSFNEKNNKSNTVCNTIHYLI